MLTRTSHVNRLKITSLSIVSNLEIGDSTYIHSFSRALAVQREAELFYGNEGHFGDYKVFSLPLPVYPIREDLTYESVPLNPFIKVNDIDITGVSTSSTVQIGSSKNIHLQSRIMHIRQLRPRE